ncbi:MAG: hypothetical protein ACYSR0_12930 [Planctomycetota bacterium]
MTIGAILIGIVLFGFVFNIGVSSEKARLTIEGSSIAYHITSSANALSLVDEGIIEIDFKGTYDIVVSYEGENNPLKKNGYYLSMSYQDVSKEERKIEDIFLTDMEETSLSSVGKVCIVKEVAGNVEVKKC